VATDQAARAARCALAMSALATDRPLAIAMGRIESGSRLPKDDLIDQTCRLLAHMRSRSYDVVVLPILSAAGARRSCLASHTPGLSGPGTIMVTGPFLFVRSVPYRDPNQEPATL